VAHARDVVGAAVPGYNQATITILTNPQTGQRTVKVEAPAKETADPTRVAAVTNALAKMANVSPNDVQINAIGPSWGKDITDKAIKAVIIFLVLVALGMWLWFDAKMALSALIALVHDILVTVGIYSLTGFQVSPATVIAFLTVLGYSLYDTIVVFDRVQENTRGVASSNRLTYSDVVNLSMNQVLARSINTSLVAILPILSILVIGAWVLGASALQDFGLALFVGLTTGAYSSIFIASPTLALLKEREPRYAEIRRRLAASAAVSKRISPAAAATGDLSGAVAVPSAAAGTSARRPGRAAVPGRSSPPRPADGSGVATQDRPDGAGAAAQPDSPTPGEQPATLPDEPSPRRRAGPGRAVAPGASGASGASGAAGEPAEPGELSEPGEPTPASLPADAREPAPAGPAVPPRAGNRPPPRPRKKGRRR
jgi:preprotein translocase subunit SecF